MISEPSIIIPVDHPSRVAEVRRNAAVAAQSEGFGEQACEEVSIIATEIGTNLIKHAHGGQVQISRLSASDEPGIEILSIDLGPGMHNLQACMADGFSS